MLALLSSGLGVALAAATQAQVLEHIHFSRLTTGRVLAVLVTQTGAVHDRVLILDRELTHVELETAARYLNESFRGWAIERVRAEVARRMEVNALRTIKCLRRSKSSAARARCQETRAARRFSWTAWRT